MALDDDADLVPAVGEYWFHPVENTPPPADEDTPTAEGYGDLGHTALEDPFAINGEGGEETVLGTWRNRSKRTVYSPRVDRVAFVLQQWTEDNYKLYYGANAELDPTTGYVMVPDNPVPVTGTLWTLIRDGDETLPLWFPRVSIYRADDITADPQALMGLPVRATILGRSGQKDLYGLKPKSKPTSSS
ncbi:hypothetical protein [Nocardiopsis sp. TNDT3]|uniref:phage tail tube protein n=1 Tax=Nocardiopsis sp. TNDT3 TaxID=2249354 RepID=UPI000E3E3F46|nr:hypothetical protein [Nocardiopsis sp. TNDT3]